MSMDHVVMIFSEYISNYLSLITQKTNYHSCEPGASCPTEFIEGILKLSESERLLAVDDIWGAKQRPFGCVLKLRGQPQPNRLCFLSRRFWVGGVDVEHSRHVDRLEFAPFLDVVEKCISAFKKGGFLGIRARLFCGYDL